MNASVGVAAAERGLDGRAVVVDGERGLEPPVEDHFEDHERLVGAGHGGDEEAAPQREEPGTFAAGTAADPIGVPGGPALMCYAHGGLCYPFEFADGPFGLLCIACAARLGDLA